MWLLRRPLEDRIRAFRTVQAALPLSYPEAGASRGPLPAGYDHDHHRTRLGAGPKVFAAACQALRDWRMFPRPWTIIYPSGAPLEPGTVVAMLARAYGLWWLNACRIVYVVDDPTPVRRFGFAYGTLPGHVESGEECFCIESDADGSVWYDVRAFSRPRYWLTRLAYPLARRMQQRFAVASQAAMREAVAELLAKG